MKRIVVSNDEMQESLDEKWVVVKEAAESIEPDRSTPDLGQMHNYFQVVDLLREEVEILKEQIAAMRDEGRKRETEPAARC